MGTTRTMIKAIPGALLLLLATATTALARPFEGVGGGAAVEVPGGLRNMQAPFSDGAGIPGGLRNMQAPFSDGTAPVAETVETVVQHGIAVGWVIALVVATALIAAGIGYALRGLLAQRPAYG